jgi:GNAT superfamily N-acetyltransferase
MIAKLCAFHGDTSRMGLAAAQAKFINGPLTAFIATQNGTPAGYLVLEPHWRPMQSGDLLDIAHLFVEDQARGSGIGRALIGHARDYARQTNACRLVIGTSPNNPQAAAIYRSMGLPEITQQPGPRFEVPLA